MVSIARGIGTFGAVVLLTGTGACKEVPRTYSTRNDGGTEIFRDDFNRDALGEHWHSESDAHSLERGSLSVHGLRNHPLWLDVELPDNVRIEFDAWSTSEEGDIKVELAGDGHSSATTENYVATGYVVVFGGWNNRLNVIARKDEHGRDRAKAYRPKVEPDRRYHVILTRTLGETGGELRWEIDGEEILTFEDPNPLVGDGHRHFAFSGWEARTHFDNLVIEAL